MRTLKIENLGSRLGSFRRFLGLSVADFNKSTGIPVSSLKKYESNQSMPGAEAIQLMASSGIDLNWLITGQGSMLIKDQEQSSEALDAALLQVVIEGIEEALQQTGRKMKPSNKAELILAVYDLYSDADVLPKQEKILKLVKSAA